VYTNFNYTGRARRIESYQFSHRDPFDLFWFSEALDSALRRKQIDWLTQAHWESNRIPTQRSLWSVPSKRGWTIRQIDRLTQERTLYDWLLVISEDEDCW